MMSTTMMVMMVMMILVGVVNKGNIWWLVTQYLCTCGLIISGDFHNTT